MPWYIYLAFKQLFPSGRVVTFFTAVSILGVFLGVWMLMIITGVMGGFGHKYGQMIIDTQGEIQVRGKLVRNYAQLQRTIESVPGVAASTPVIEGVVMVQNGEKISFPGALGVDARSVEKVMPIEKYMKGGKLDALDDDTIIVSSGVQAELGIRYLGEKVLVITPLTLEKMNQDAILFPAELAVAGAYQFGHQQLDKTIVIISLRRAQELFGYGDAVRGINVRLKPGVDAWEAKKAIAEKIAGDGWPPLQVLTWMESGEAFLFALKIERIMVILIVSVVILVVAFLVTAMLFVSVVRKTREIGLYGALGASPRQSAMCFCFQGVLIGLVGTILGLGAGFLTLAYLDPIVRFLAWLTGSWELLVAIYEFTQVPTHITPENVVLICAYAIGMATLSGLIAAWRAARLKPVEAMRSE